MERTRDEPLAGAGLAAKKDRRGARRRRCALEDQIELVPQPPDAGAVADDVREGRHPSLTFSTQYVMSISRYIAVAAVRCRRASSRWPARSKSRHRPAGQCGMRVRI